jgi:hypothetical protein
MSQQKQFDTNEYSPETNGGRTGANLRVLKQGTHKVLYRIYARCLPAIVATMMLMALVFSPPLAT